MLHITRILVPVDFSKYSSAALARAVELAEQFKAELRLLHVASDKDADAHHVAVEQLERLVSADMMLKLKVSHVATAGVPAREIVRQATTEKVDWIVMGTHGRTGLKRLALGSVAEEVLRTAPCPVMIVRHPDQLVPVNVEEAAVAQPEHGSAQDLIRRAASQRATDIHIDPVDDGRYGVRFRIDGRLQAYCQLDRDVAERLIHQLKILGNLDIADPFRPRESRLRLPSTMAAFEVRITTSPVAGG